MIVINKDQVKAALPVEEALTLVEKAMREASSGKAVLPLRWGLEMPDGGLMGMMPGYMQDPECFGIKVVNIMPENAGTTNSSHMGCVLLFDAREGTPLAMIEAGELTAIRTAAASALATKTLAREDASVLTILGAGEQARAHLEALYRLRPFREFRIWSRTLSKAEEYRDDMSAELGIDIKVCGDVKEAVHGAGVICTATSSPTSILPGDWLEPGMHLNVVGASVADRQEIDTTAVRRSRYYVDYRSSTEAQAGDFINAVREGAVGDDHIVGEIGDVLAGRAPGRSTAEEITLYRSLGVATQDLIVAWHLYQKGLTGTVGTPVAFP